MIAGLTRNMDACDSYLKDEAYTEELWEVVESSCGCSYPNCRELNVVYLPEPSFWHFRFTCKETATAACRTSVKEFTNIWAEVPTKDDEVCFNAYQETKLWATSCN